MVNDKEAIQVCTDVEITLNTVPKTSIAVLTVLSKAGTKLQPKLVCVSSELICLIMRVLQ